MLNFHLLAFVWSASYHNSLTISCTSRANYATGRPDQIIAEKDNIIRELRETVQILQLKVSKLEQLMQLKDTQIETLTKTVSNK